MKLTKRLAQGLIALALVVASLVMTPRAHAATGLNPSYTSVQLFKWSWNDIATECTQFLGPQGYGGVQISPPMAAVNDGFWYGMYQPVNYKVLTSQMGTAAQLQTMINTCHAAGVRVYADIVTNQMAGGSSSSGTSGTATDGSTWDSGTLTYPDFNSGSGDFHTPSCSISQSDYNGTTPAGANGATSALQSTYDVQHCWLDGMPDLATENADVQTKIENYMELLISMGVDGFRMDAAKHQQEDQLAIIFAAVKTVYPTTLEGEPLFVTQEITPDGEVNRSSYEALGTLNEFQFTYAMQNVFRNMNGYSLSSIPTIMGTPDSWGGSWNFLPSASAQIFVDNWDTERNSGGSLTASDYSGDTNDAVATYRYDLANIFMLAQPYGVMAQVQSGFRFTDNNQDMPATGAFVGGVAQLPTSRSTVNSGWDFIHRWPDIANMVAFRTATWGLGESNWVTGTNNQIAFSRGNVGFVALNNDTTAWQQTFQTGLPTGTYCNVVNGILSGSTCAADTVTVDSTGNAILNIPANGGSVVPAVAIYTGQQLPAATGPTSPYPAMYLRGDMDGWSADATAAMTLVSDDTWQYSATLTAGKAYGYKYDASGSWTTGEQWGDPSSSGASTTSGTALVNGNNLNFTPATSGIYVFSFNDKTLAYSVALPTSPYPTMYLRGDMDGWAATTATLMTLVSNDTWQFTATLAAGTKYGYKYDASGAWTTGQQWGDSGTPGLAQVNNNNNIYYTPATSGDYIFTFNDSTLAYSVTASTTAPVVPAAPTGLASSLVTATGLTLTWTAPSGATSYTVYRSTSATGPFTTSVGAPTTNSYADTGLVAATTYYYEVSATNSAGTSANSTAFSATTLAASAYKSPYGAMYLRGSMNSWGTTAMTLVADDTWQYTATLPTNQNAIFKFDASGSWTLGQQWGDSGTPDLAEVNSNTNMSYTTGTGTMYLFTFNDSTLAYSVTPAITPSFTMTVAPDTLFVTAGKTNTTVITLTPVNKFDPTTPVAFSCSSDSLPTGVTCTFSPTTVDAAGNIDATLTVSASTSANTVGDLRMKSLPFLPGSALALAVCFMGWKKRRVLPVLLAVLCLFGVALFTGCGKGARPITPAISTITVVATAQPAGGYPAVKQTATFTIAVQK